MAKIVIRNLTKTYSGGGVVALRISISSAANESLVFWVNGCGKTTLLRIIDCLIARDQGDVLIDGVPVTQPRRTSRWFSNTSACFREAAGENIARIQKLRGGQGRRRRRLLNATSSS
jgi:ABC-type sugar transport system ATPase subunit